MINIHRSFISVIGVSLALIILASGLFLRGVNGANDNDQTTQTTPAAKNLLGAKLEQTYAPADFNGDGLMDVAVTDFVHDTVSVMVGDRAGYFHSVATLSSVGGPRAIVAADFNRDGAIDLAVAGFFSGDVAIFLGRGDGSFHNSHPVKLSEGLTSIIAEDFNSNGVLDLAAANFLSGEIVILNGSGDGSFETQAVIGQVRTPTLILSRDFDGDGLQDLVAFGASEKEIRLFTGEGNGSFKDAGNVGPAMAISFERGQKLTGDKTLLAGESRAIRKLFGDGQSALAGTALPQPLVVEVGEQGELSRAERQVVFSILYGDARLEASNVQTADEQGQASLSLSLGELLGNNLVAATAEGQVAVFGEFSTFSYADFFEKIRAALAQLPLEQSRIREQHALLDEAERRLGVGDEVGAVTKLRGSTGLLATVVALQPDGHRSVGEPVDLLKKLVNQVLLFGSASPASQPEPIACGETRCGTISTPGQQRLYSFSGSAGEVVNVSVASTSGTLCPVIRLINDASGSTIADTSPFCNTRTGNVSLPANGAYTIMIAARDINQTGSFCVNLQFTSGRCAAPISCGLTLSGDINPAPEMEVYTFTASAGEVVNVSAVGTSGNVCPVIELRSPSNTTLTNTSPFCNTRTGNISLPASGTYKIVISARDITQTGAYNVNLQFTSGRCAIPTSCGVTLAGSISPAPKIEVYSFAGNMGEVVKVSALGTSGTLCPTIELRSPTGATLTNTSPFCNTRTGNISLPTTGTYSIVIAARDIGQTGSYSVNLQFTSGRCAPSISCGPSLFDAIIRVPEIKVYSFCGRIGGIVNVSAVGTSGNLCPVIELRSPSGMTLRDTSPFCNTSTGNVTLNADGLYTAVIAARDLGQTGDLTVNLSCIGAGLGGPCPPPPMCPTVSTIVPTSGLVGTPVTINGSNFTGVNAVSFFNNRPAVFTIISDTQIRATVPSGAETGPITISKPNCPDVQTAPFAVTPPSNCPTASSINPTSGGVGTQVVITGTNFNGVNAVKFFNNVTATFTVNSNTQITATVPNGATTGPITISKPGCTPDAQTPLFTIPGSCIPVSLPSELSGPANGSLMVPITVPNLTGRGIVSYDFTVTFDPSVLRPSNPPMGPVDKTGTLSSAMTITPNTGTPGRLTVSAFGTTPLSGAGTLLFLKFDLIGASGRCSNLTWASFRFNEGTPCATPTNGRVCVADSGTIAGTVSYCISPKAVPGVVVTAAGTPPKTNTTNSAGNYQLTELGSGSYTVTPTKTGDVNGITSFDASLVAQCVVGIRQCTSCEQLAGDASNDGNLTSFDASLIAQTAAGIGNSGIAGTWKFVPPNRSYPSVTGNLTNQNFDAVLVGDVSGNWSPSASGLAPVAELQANLVDEVAQAPISLPTTSGTSGSSVTIPITVGNLTGRGYVAYDFDITFNNNVLQLQNPPIDAAGTLSSAMNITPNATTPGRLRVSAFGTAALAGAGTLLNLKFNVVGAPGALTDLTWQRFLFNEEAQTNLVNGRFTVAGQPTPPTVTTAAASSVTNTGATLNGSVNPNGSATNIWFEWGTSSTLASFSTTPMQAVGSGTANVAVSANLNGLAAGTTYYFRLVGASSAGTARGIISPPFTTLGSPNPIPVITSLSPNSANAGGLGFTLTVNGANFVNGSVVRWNGNNRTTTFIRSTQLTAAILASDIATAGAASVTVFNPASGGGTSIALTFTINQSVTATLTATPTTVTPGGQLTVSWTASGGLSAFDWIGLFRVGDPNTSNLWWRSTNRAPSGSFTLAAPTERGLYQFRYLLNDGYTDVARSNVVTVDTGAYTLTCSPNPAPPGGQLTICWNGPSGRPATDWIGLYRVGDPNTNFLWWRYTGGTPSGCFTLTAPTQAGQYEFRYLLQDGYTDVARCMVSVEGTFTVIATPTIVTPGGQLTVSWTAAGGRSALDWIGLHRAGDPNTIFSWWRYTNGAPSGSFTLNAPTQAGQYQFRYLLNDGYTDVARSNIVTVSNSLPPQATNRSTTTQCAEEDNVNIPFTGRIASFIIEATHPTYPVPPDNCAPDFSNCPPAPPGFPFTPGVFKLFDDGETVVEAVREASWWRPNGMAAAVDDQPQVMDVHYIRIYRRIAGTSEYPQVLVLYQDGNLRLIPQPPVGARSVCFGSSVIIGPAAPAQRPIAEIVSVTYFSRSQSLEIRYRDGGTAVIILRDVNRNLTRVQVNVNYPTDAFPFATFRSMLVADGNADVDHVKRMDAAGVMRDDPIMTFPGGAGTEWFFYRQTRSRHNTSAPDIRIRLE